MIFPRFIKFNKFSRYVIVKQMNLKLRSDEGGICTESSLVWNQLITSSCFELYMWCPEISLSKSLCNWGTSSVSYKNVEICIALFHTYQNFFCIYITICKYSTLLQHLTHKCMGHMYVTMISGLIALQALLIKYSNVASYPLRVLATNTIIMSIFVDVKYHVPST